MAAWANNSNKINKLIALKKKQFSGQKGQVAVVVGILIVSLIGMAAFVVDTGSIYSTRRSLQTAADAAALAGAQELPDTSAASSAALNCGGINVGYSGGGAIQVTDISGSSITVRAENPNLGMAFAGVLGKDTVNVYADATAQIGSPSVIGPITEIGYSGDNANYVVPFGILSGSFSPGSELILEENYVQWSFLLNPWDNLTVSSWAPLDIGGSSRSDYMDCVRSGADISVSTGMGVGTIGWTVGWDVFGASVPAIIERVSLKKNNQWDGIGSLAKGNYVLAAPDSQFVICPIISNIPVIEGESVTIVGFAPFIITDYIDNPLGISGIRMTSLSKAIIVSDSVMSGSPENGISVIRLTN